ncbi:NAD(P)-dependent oxidoreductase [Telmatospirillum siberiense]|uniref:Dihydropyrimidine dehydrogenase n=1 Tax=Telmatospirillum siberiense TaxID=382514 RepID=A0A2N3PVI5_9PROT|nr:NAD(P)-dependent oxidoreductase [Telmatospirillum siberiense]PKU24413.1 dihydropyrimidine dehydrogenase [Telmatospirillum siberiense]
MTAAAHNGPQGLDDDLVPPLNALQAMAESSRCLYCYDPACVNACPTGIDIPGFIHRINDGNVVGAAKTILSANIMGGTCARVCPTEILCEQACVRNAGEQRPVSIGRLQRFATDALMARGGGHPFARAPGSGKRVAVVGAGPSGLACAHRLSMLGHAVNIFEAKAKPGGLNEYGLAAYKMTGDFAQREVAFILGIGGIDIHYGKRLGDDLQLGALSGDYDAVFLAIGLAAGRPLGVEGSDLAGVMEALSFIEALRQGRAPAVAGRVVVIGGGNTAVDAAIQSHCLGAEDVVMAYRRGIAQMGATTWEQQLARISGVAIKPWLAPKRILGSGGKVTGVVFERTRLVDGRLQGTGTDVELSADLVLSAVGQELREGELAGIPVTEGRIGIDADYQTARPGVFAGGDCVKSGLDLTVQAVEDGKRAALAIDRFIRKGVSHGRSA